MMRIISPTIARRLAITRQHLAGPRPPPTPSGILEVVQALGCIQIDPISVVAPSHQLVLWSRLGTYSQADLDKLLWEEHKLLEDWAHCTSFIPTEDYPIFSALKRSYVMPQRMREWVRANKTFQRYLLRELQRHGPLPTHHFQDKAKKDWYSTGWTKGKNVSRMLTYLWIKGKIMVNRRKGTQKWWDLTERVLPDWTPQEKLSYSQIAPRIAEKAIRALGVARRQHIYFHYIRGEPGNLPKVLTNLEAEGQIMQVKIRDPQINREWRGPWYIHTSDIPLLDQLEAGKWRPHTTLLSPFDNLIYDRARTEQLFDFKFRLEIYVPKAKRQYGYYVLPILDGDRFIGRLDPEMNKTKNELFIKAIFTEPDISLNPEIVARVRASIQKLADFLGAQKVVYIDTLYD